MSGDPQGDFVNRNDADLRHRALRQPDENPAQRTSAEDDRAAALPNHLVHLRRERFEQLFGELGIDAEQALAAGSAQLGENAVLDAGIEAQHRQLDLVMAALRARLQRLAKDKRTARSGAAVAARRKEERSEAGEIANLQQLPPREFDRALVGPLLEQELGEGLGSDPRFKELIERTSSILVDDPEIQTLFREIQQQAR
jgi:hypothetical protein